MSEAINIALGFDRAFAPHAAAVIASIVRHAPGRRFHFLLLYADVDAGLRARVEAAAPGASFLWREIGDDDVPAMANREHFSRAILFRLGLSKYAPAEWRRVIYLDCDAIVTRDIALLWNADLQGRALGAVVDCFVEGERFAKTWRLAPPAGDYFNSGVLLIDLERARAERVFEHALAFVALNLETLRFADQDALNFAAWGRWTRLDNCWNVQRHMAVPSLANSIAADRRLNGAAAAVVHFTGPEKPWRRDGYHPWSWLYWDNIARTPFAAELAQASGIGRLRQLVLWQRWRRRRGAAL